MPVDVNALCMTFLLFLNQQAVYEVLDTCPTVRVIDVTNLQEMACGGSDCPAKAFYNLDDKTIYLSNELDLENAVHKSILLHELVHYAQDVTGKWIHHDVSECRSFLMRELAAFKVQERYLLDNNIQHPVGRQLLMYRC